MQAAQLGCGRVEARREGGATGNGGEDRPNNMMDARRSRESGQGEAAATMKWMDTSRKMQERKSDSVSICQDVERFAKVRKRSECEESDKQY